MQQLSVKEHFEMLLNAVSLKAGFLPYLVDASSTAFRIFLNVIYGR